MSTVNRHCIVCWCVIPSSTSPSKEGTGGTDGFSLKTVLKCLAVYLKVDSKCLEVLWRKKEGDGGKEIGSCAKCSQVLKVFWKLYCKLIGFQLEIDVKLEGLLECMEERKGNEDGGVEGDLERWRFRGKLREKCWDKVTKTKPRICLERVAMPMPTPKILDEEERVTDEDFNDLSDTCDDNDVVLENCGSEEPMSCPPEEDDSLKGQQTSNDPQENDCSGSSSPILSKPNKRKKSCAIKAVKSRSKGQVFHCPISSCFLYFKLKKDMENHQQLHGTFSCQFCSEVKSYAPDLSKHELQVHSKKTDNSTESNNKSECPRCFQSFGHQNLYLEHHVQAHLGLTMRVRSCDICQASFPSASTKAAHYRTYHQTEGVDPSSLRRCDQCPAYFLQVRQLYRHKRQIHHEKNDNRKKCADCGRFFSFYQNLLTHRKSMHGYNDQNPDHPLACDLPECKKRFCTEDELDLHKRFGHRKLRLEQIKCVECGRLCNGKNGLLKHMQSHKRGMYVCEQCGLEFVKKCTLDRHYLFHKSPEEWDYQCQECGKKFQTVYNLKAHARVHTGEKPWECTECQKKYSCKMKWKKHMKNVHNVEIELRKKAKARFISKREVK